MADVITRLKLESGEYDSKIKRATQGLLQMEQECRKVGGTLAVLEKDQLEFVKGLGKMQTVSTSVRGKIGELSSAYTELRSQYNRLTDAEKRGEFGRALSSSLDQLKVRIKDSRTELESINRELSGSKFGQFGSMIDIVGQKFGVTGNLTELLTSKTAMLTAGIGASIAVIGKATEAWTKYNSELAKQDQITTVTTGLKGPGADAMTDAARAMVDTYNVDFREAINAANMLMSQFGVSGSEAIQLLRDGMQGMIQGDGPKLLSMIQQYAPAFRDAGISASQLVAVIHNSEGGIFTDQNMNAIVMGIKNIRLMTNATSEALAKLGIDGQDMSRKLSDGSMTIFDALKQVAGAIKNVDSNSKAAGEVMQQVFGRQGVTAGTNLGKAIETLNTNLEETKRQTGEVGDAFAELQTANEKLNIAIRDCFEYDGWDQMAKGIQAKLVTALANVLQMISNIKGALGGFSVGQQQGDIKNGGGSFIDNAVDKLKGGKTPGKERMMRNQIQAYTKQIFRINDQIADIQNKIGEDMDGNMSVVYEKQIRTLENRRDAIRKNMNEYERRANEVLNAPGNTNATNNIKPLHDTKPTKSGGNKKDPELEMREYQLKKWEDAERKAAFEVGKIREKEIKDAEKRAKELQPNTVGINIQTNSGLSAYISDLKKQIDNAEIGSYMYQSLSNQLADTTMLQNLVKESMKAGLGTAMFDAVDESGADIWTRAMEGAVNDADWQAIADVINKKLEEMGREGLKLNFGTGDVSGGGNKEQEEGESLGDKSTKLVSGLSSVASGLQQMGIKLPEGVQKMLGIAQGVMTVVSGVGTIISVFQIPLQTKQTISTDLNTASLTFNTAALWAVETALWANSTSNWLGFANGGIIPHAASGHYVGGENYSGDTTPILANAGELILNKAEQGNLATQLEGSNTQNMRLEATIKGEDIRLSLNNNSRRRGRGEYVTNKFVRG